MNQLQRKYLSQLIQQHINNICLLRFAEYGKADALCGYTKQIAKKYFPKQSLYIMNLQRLGLKIHSNRVEKNQQDWNESVEQLLTIAQSMLTDLEDDVSLAPTSFSESFDLQSSFSFRNKSFLKENTILLIALVSLSLWLWLFNDIVHWNWLSNHPKRIPILITFQLLLILIAFFMTNANKKYKERAAIILTVILSAIALF